MIKTNKLSLTIALLGAVAMLFSNCKKDDDNHADNTFTDPRDGNVYKMATIGNQIWMAENLRFSGNIPQVSGNTAWAAIIDTKQPAWCFHDNNPANDAKYGKLYNWYAVNAGNLCPPDWHLPTDAEWSRLIQYLGGSDNAGGKMKTITGWDSPNVDATNESGFSGLPGSSRDADGTFFDLTGGSGNWWSSTEYIADYAWYYKLIHSHGSVFRSDYFKVSGYSVRCLKQEIPFLTTSGVTEITKTTAISGGNITNDGVGSVTARGICWSINENPTISDSKTMDGAGTGAFTSSISSLDANKTYYVRAYATNSAGTGYGDQRSFTTYKEDAITDIDGNYYNVVTIGNQQWLAENLRTSRFNEGIGIPTEYNYDDWESLTTGAYYVHPHNGIDGLDSEAEVLQAYGILYNWYAVETGKLCPTGWHVPTYAEWMALTNYAGGVAVAGGKLKSIRTTPDAHPRWQGPDTGATDEYGFSALPGGSPFGVVGIDGDWWTATDDVSGTPWYWRISRSYAEVWIFKTNKNKGSSVRCIKD